jgi:hypothetical protein
MGCQWLPNSSLSLFTHSISQMQFCRTPSFQIKQYDVSRSRHRQGSASTGSESAAAMASAELDVFAFPSETDSEPDSEDNLSQLSSDSDSDCNSSALALASSSARSDSEAEESDASAKAKAERAASAFPHHRQGQSTEVFCVYSIQSTLNVHLPNRSSIFFHFSFVGLIVVLVCKFSGLGWPASSSQEQMRMPVCYLS